MGFCRLGMGHPFKTWLFQQLKTILNMNSEGATQSSIAKKIGRVLINSGVIINMNFPLAASLGLVHSLVKTYGGWLYVLLHLGLCHSQLPILVIFKLQAVRDMPSNETNPLIEMTGFSLTLFVSGIGGLTMINHPLGNVQWESGH